MSREQILLRAVIPKMQKKTVTNVEIKLKITSNVLLIIQIHWFSAIQKSSVPDYCVLYNIKMFSKCSVSQTSSLLIETLVRPYMNAIEQYGWGVRSCGTVYYAVQGGSSF